MDEAATEAFFLSGVAEIEGHLKLIRKTGPTFEPKSALDFGCGVGRLTRALATITGDAVGVDISPGMLAEARRFQSPSIAFQDALPDRQFDWITSIIVFQHIPPARGYGLLRDLVQRLRPGGALSLHLTLYKDRLALGAGVTGLGLVRWDGQTLTPLPVEPPPPGAMMMYDYDLAVVVAILFEAGISDLRLRHTDHDGYHGALIAGRRRPD